MMNWYRIEVQKGLDKTYTFVGASTDSLEELAKKIQVGETIRLDDLVYNADGTTKEWSGWDDSVIPSIVISAKAVVTVMQFKGDPRKVGNN